MSQINEHSSPAESASPTPPDFVSDEPESPAIAPEAVERIEKLVSDCLDAVSTLPLGGPEYNRAVAAIDRLGERDFVATSALSGRVLDRRFGAMRGLLAAKAPLARQLADLRKAAAKLDPTTIKLDRRRSARDEVDEIDRYFERFARTQPHLESLLGSLTEGRLALEQDNAAILTEQASLATEMETLRQYAFLAARLDDRLTAWIDEAEADAAARARSLRGPRARRRARPLALAPRYGELLGLGAIFKPQNGIIWLWLVRQRAWRRVVTGVALTAAVVVLTLPLTGIGMWSEWIRALAAYQRSQEIEPTFYGIGLGRWLPELVLIPLAAGVVCAALLRRGRKGLARLGLASVVASPSLWIHGFVFAIPEFLRLRGQWFWLTVGLCAFGRWPGPQIAIVMVVAGWFVGPRVSSLTERFLPRATAGPTIHPLGRRAVQVGVAPAAKLAAAGHSTGHAAPAVAMDNLPEA